MPSGWFQDHRADSQVAIGRTLNMVIMRVDDDGDDDDNELYAAVSIIFIDQLLQADFCKSIKS